MKLKAKDVHIAEVSGWPEWRREAQRLEEAGRAILADEDTYGAYLDAVAAGKPRAPPDRRPAAQPHRGRTRQGGRGGETGRHAGTPAPKQEEGIAYILDDPERLRELREQLKRRERKIGQQRKKSRGLSM